MIKKLLRKNKPLLSAASLYIAAVIPFLVYAFIRPVGTPEGWIVSVLVSAFSVVSAGIVFSFIYRADSLLRNTDLFQARRLELLKESQKQLHVQKRDFRRSLEGRGEPIDEEYLDAIYLTAISQGLKLAQSDEDDSEASNEFIAWLDKVNQNETFTDASMVTIKYSLRPLSEGESEASDGQAEERVEDGSPVSQVMELSTEIITEERAIPELIHGVLEGSDELNFADSDDDVIDVVFDEGTSGDDDGAGAEGTSSPKLEIKDNETIVEVSFGTNRNRIDGAKLYSEYYGGETDNIKYGRAQVSIPANHKDGKLERPKWYHVFGEQPGKHILLKGITELKDADFFNKLRSDVEQSDEQRAFIFIHGFNTSFEEGVWRTAQIAYDLFGEERTDEGFENLSIVPIYFSWPSNGSVLSYGSDGTKADRSAAVLMDFLRDVSEKTGVKELTVIAHSMGNRVLTRALARVGDQMREADGPVVKEIIMAAPDFDAETFQTLAEAVEKTGERITLYASSRDKALKASKLANGYRRLGDAGQEITVLQKGDTIDATHLGEDMFAHTYVAEKPMLDDIHGIILKREAPDLRRWLKKVSLDDAEYWEFKRT